MKIAIMGSGGIGGFYGGRLAKAGEDVTFIARGAHLEAMLAKGLHVMSHYGDFHLPTVQATDDPASIGPVDLVIVATKGYALEEAIQALRPLVGPETVILPLLNGVDIAERIGSAVGSEHVLGGLCTISSAIAEPGVIRQVSPFQVLILGEFSGEATPRATAIEAALKNAEINAILTDAIQKEIWNKFIFIASLAGVCSVVRKTSGPVLSDPDTRAFMEGCMHEIEVLARKQGIPLDDSIVPDTLARFDGFPPDSQPSMMLDLERGRPLELEALNGTVMRMGAALGVPTPINDFIYAALKLHAAGRQP